MQLSFVRKPNDLFIVVLASLALASVACTDDEDEMAGPEIPECDSSVTLSVTQGTTPTFTWTPECTLFSLGIELTATDEDQWVIVSETGGNTIAPGIRYGEVPPGASQAAPPLNLLPGEAYTVVVIRLLGQDQILAGFAEFIP